MGGCGGGGGAIQETGADPVILDSNFHKGDTKEVFSNFTVFHGYQYFL